MAEYNSPPDHSGYPPRGGDILNELLVQSQLQAAERFTQEALGEGAIPHDPLPYGIPGLAAQRNGVSRPPQNAFVASSEDELDEDQDPLIPQGAFLLRCPHGDVALWPEGISFEAHFIVLFFKNQRDLHFTPRLKTKFQGQYEINLEDDDDPIRQKLDLFYSGITFTIPEQETVAVIFHLTSNVDTPTGFVSRTS